MPDTTNPNKTTERQPDPRAPLRHLTHGRKEVFKFHASDIRPIKGFNARRQFTGLGDLAESMYHHGQEKPISVRPSGDQENPLDLIDGERRWRAAQIINQKHDPDWTLECKIKPKTVKSLDLLVSQLIANEGVPFTFLEKAQLYRRILDEADASGETMKPAELSRHTGETKQAISDALVLVDQGAEELIRSVERDDLAATTAVKIVRMAADSDQQRQILWEASERASAAGRKQIKPRDLEQTASADPDPATDPAPDPTPDPDPNPSGATADDHPGEDPEPPAPRQARFTAYHLTGRPSPPADSADYPEGTEPEQYRLALEVIPEDWDDANLSGLHILLTNIRPFTGAEPQFAIGYRIMRFGGQIDEYLPRRFGWVCPVANGIEFLTQLQQFCENEMQDFPNAYARLAEAWFDAAEKHSAHTGSGVLEDTEPLQWASPADPGAMDRLKGADDTSRHGSKPGSGDKGDSGDKFSPPDKQLKKIEKLLDDLDSKGTTVNADRLATTEIILRLIRNESSVKDLRSHLTTG